MAKEQAALYCRVSSKGQAGPDKVSLPDQQVWARDICVKQDLGVFSSYVEARSATGDDIEDRPQLMRLLADAEAGKFQWVVCYDLDRLRRNMDAGSDIARRLRKAGVGVITPQGVTNFAKSTDRLLDVVTSWSAEGEAERIAQRTWGAKRTRGKAGQFAFAQRLYGYRWNAKERRPEPIPEELEVVEFIFELAAKHHTSHQIAKLLNGAGYRPREARRWSASLVAAILGDERYAGKWVSWRGDYRPPKHVERDPEDEGKEWLARPEFRPEPAVSRKVWLAAQKSKAYHRRRTRRPIQHAFLLAGVARCAHCGSLLTGRAIGVEPITRYYTCCMAVRCRDEKTDCPAGYIPAVALERQVWAYVEGLIEDPDLLRRSAALAEQDQLPAKREEEQRLRRAVASCDREVGTLLGKLGREVISDEDFQLARARLGADRAAWQERAEELRAWMEERQAKAAAVDAAAELLTQARGKLDSFEERRRLLRLLDFRVEVGCEDWGKRKSRDYRVTLDSVLFSYDQEVVESLALLSGLR